MKKKKKTEEHDNAERWLLSYADFITLLMVFFIIMYSMSAVNQSKFEALSQSLNEAMANGEIVFSSSGSESGSGDDVSIGSDGKIPPIVNKPEEPALDLSSEEALEKAEQEALLATKQQIQDYLDEYGLESSVSLKIDERGLVVTITDAATFESGSAEIKSSFIPELNQIADILSNVDKYVRIEGHTDNVPVSGGRYRSNWELSTARATSVVQLFIRNSSIPPQQLSAVGYGEYRPIAPNETSEGRAQNRRVEIVVIRSKFNSVEASG